MILAKNWHSSSWAVRIALRIRKGKTAFREQMVSLWLAGDGGCRTQAQTAEILQDGKEHTFQGNPFLSCIRQVSTAFPSQLFSSQRLPIPPVLKHSAQKVLCPSHHTVGHHIPKPISHTPSQIPSVPESTSTFLQSTCKPSSLHTCPVSFLPKSFERKLEVKPQTNCPLEPPRQHSVEAKTNLA